MFTRKEVTKLVKENILRFWQGLTDRENGGFFGKADFSGVPDKTADKGGILHSRILWTFSAAYGLLNDESYLASADHAREFLLKSFLDKKHGGLYWLVDHKGSVFNDRKQFYNLAFGIYGLSEHYLATGDKLSLDTANALFEKIEAHGADSVNGGYIEAARCDWSAINDFRLSVKDINCPKSMNTNLHILEAYTALLRAGKDGKAREALKKLLRVTLDKIVNGDRHFNLFFNMAWRPLSGDVSWGHDIEGSWLLYEAALALEDESLISEAKKVAVEIANAVYDKAIDREYGGLLSGCTEGGKIYDKKEWWPQAEAVVGFYNAYELSGDKKYLEAAEGIWDFIEKYFIDLVHGEWHNELSRDNKPDTLMPKAGFWKCPYHNARTCFELIKRVND